MKIEALLDLVLVSSNNLLLEKFSVRMMKSTPYCMLFSEHAWFLQLLGSQAEAKTERPQ